MPPRKIYLVRHAQAFHNIAPFDSSLADPVLTLTGIQQASMFCRDFPHHDDISVILSSPTKRTLRTSLLCFRQPTESVLSIKREWNEHHHTHPEDGHVRAKAEIHAIPELQETSSHPCDIGSTREELEKVFEGQGIDFSAVREGWQLKGGVMGAEKEAVVERARMVREWLGNWFGADDVQGRGEDVVIVSHAGFLHYLTRVASASSTPPTSTTPTPHLPPALSAPTHPAASLQWQNTEYRTFTLHRSAPEADWELVETKESLQRRQG